MKGEMECLSPRVSAAFILGAAVGFMLVSMHISLERIEARLATMNARQRDT
jgi:hypothetical protein